MTMTIATAGKGGTGKTTFSSLLIKYIHSQGLGYILAIDGDPSSNLHLALGMGLDETIGSVREDTATQIKSGRYDPSIPKPDFYEYRINQCLIEGNGIDLIAMGRPEGPGCYCAANNILRNVIDRLGDQYDFVVIDNEAGMEHISRQTTRVIDKLFVVTDLTMRGVAAAGHIVRLTEDLGTRIQETHLIVNRTGPQIPEVLQQKIDELVLQVAGTVPDDQIVAEFDVVGRPTFEIGEEAPVYRAVAEIAARAGIV